MQDNELTKTIDAMLSELYKPDEPGAAVIITKNGEVIFRKGYGLANLELGVPIEPHMVFRLGSITKQFTAVAILMLYEEGKLDLQDDITKFLPDYPTHGHTITIEHLLHHTSGIKSYTNIKEWMEYITVDLTVAEMIDRFKYRPMEFAPGEKFNYNNSGYFLLGAIIEKISGMTYTEFLQKYIFEPLGMKHSYYDMPNLIIPGRASGYKKVDEGFENCEYLSMTHPYAAGSLASNVDDMAIWDEALYTEKLVKQETLQKAWTPAKLNNGESTGYGYGWAVANFQGTNLVMHGGGIPGFICDGFRFPDDHIYVSILTNLGEEIPDLLPYKIGSLVAGRSYVEPVAIELDGAVYEKFSAVYEIELMGFEVPIELEDGKLVAQMPMAAEGSTLYPLSETEYFIRDSVQRVNFELDEDGNVSGLRIKGFYGPGMYARRTDKLLPSQKESIELDAAALEAFVGEYQVAAGMNAAITLEDGRLMVQVPGQPRLQLHAESETKFFIKEAPVVVTFEKEASGQVSAVVIRQAGQDMPARKVK
ncbi:MAG: serine hydrolase [Anaerolineaceae bacterium]|nr:serine hydrolase [Anaerolineaceae bacterium]